MKNKKLKELLDAINAKKGDVKALVAQNKLEEARTAKDELKKMQEQFDLLYDLDEEEEEQEKAGAAQKQPLNKKDEKPTLKAVQNALVNAIKAGLLHKPVAQDDVQILNMGMDEGAKDDDGNSDGGLTVPQDIATQIRELRRAASDDLEMYVNVEPVATLTGSRPIEKDADSTPWPDVEEGGEFQEQDTPQFVEISYKIKKRGGILKITKELLADTAENIMAYINKWIAKKSRATRNAKILSVLSTITDGNEIAVSDLDGLKKIFNVQLDPAIAEGASVYTNQSGYNWLDTLKDSDGKYILQPDPAQPTRTLLFGKYPVVKLSDKVLKSVEVVDATSQKVTGHKVPLICGDLKEAVTLFDREKITIDISDVAGDLWAKDKTGVKVRDRFDVQAVDEEAVVKAEATIAVAG